MEEIAKSIALGAPLGGMAGRLFVELRDVKLERVLASQAITVIREALQLRRKRKQPWNLFS